MILVFTEVATKVIGSHQQNRVHSTVCYSKWKTDQALLPPLTLPPPGKLEGLQSCSYRALKYESRPSLDIPIQHPCSLLLVSPLRFLD